MRLFALLPAAALIAMPQIATASPNHKPGAKAAHSHSQAAKHSHKTHAKTKAAPAKKS